MTHAGNCSLPIRIEFGLAEPGRGVAARATSVVFLPPIGACHQAHDRPYGFSNFGFRTAELRAPGAQRTSRPRIVRALLALVDSRVGFHGPDLPGCTPAAKPFEAGAAPSIELNSVVRIARAPCWKAHAGAHRIGMVLCARNIALARVGRRGVSIGLRRPAFVAENLFVGAIQSGFGWILFRCARWHDSVRLRIDVIQHTDDPGAMSVR